MTDPVAAERERIHRRASEAADLEWDAFVAGEIDTWPSALRLEAEMLHDAGLSLPPDLEAEAPRLAALDAETEAEHRR